MSTEDQVASWPVLPALVARIEAAVRKHEFAWSIAARENLGERRTEQ